MAGTLSHTEQSNAYLNPAGSAMRMSDAVLLERSLALLHRFGTEQTGWRGFFRRWYYSDEPLRNDAANLVREAGYGFACMPEHTRLVGGKS